MMPFEAYAKVRLGLSRRLVESYEEEATQTEMLELERRQLMKALQDNFKKMQQLHRRKEDERRGLKNEITKLEADYNGGRKEAYHG